MRSSFLTLQRGNAVRDALRRKEDAERPERHANAEHWHDGWLKRQVCGGLDGLFASKLASTSRKSISMRRRILLMQAVQQSVFLFP
ncbi:DUF1534 domain-containing protein [Pseudomonas syringae UB303]|uniref:DUF1534 domain-containing protein n=1 Tax=Pseudomonas syringae UB303 TaxID=1357287 RepID=A0AAJ4E3J6_PSESX|nr:DUF1534 domain-containing protein [Pseudomonas syringae UB303]